jgi:hypothetical protein
LDLSNSKIYLDRIGCFAVARLPSDHHNPNLLRLSADMVLDGLGRGMAALRYSRAGLSRILQAHTSIVSLAILKRKI